MSSNPPDPHSEQQLMIAVSKGDWRSFEPLVRAYQKPLVNFFTRSGVSSDAEDCAQRTFLRIWNYRNRYKATAKFSTFLWMIARQVFLDEVRHQAHVKRLHEGYKQEQTSTTTTPNHDTLPDVASAVASLPTNLRETILRAYMQGMKYDEIAQEMNVPLGTVKSRVFHALKRMRAFLEKQ